MARLVAFVDITMMTAGQFNAILAIDGSTNSVTIQAMKTVPCRKICSTTALTASRAFTTVMPRAYVNGSRERITRQKRTVSSEWRPKAIRRRSKSPSIPTVGLWRRAGTIALAAVHETNHLRRSDQRQATNPQTPSRKHIHGSVTFQMHIIAEACHVHHLTTL